MLLKRSIVSSSFPDNTRKKTYFYIITFLQVFQRGKGKNPHFPQKIKFFVSHLRKKIEKSI